MIAKQNDQTLIRVHMMENKHPKRKTSGYSKEKVLEISKRRVYVARYFVPE